MSPEGFRVAASCRRVLLPLSLLLANQLGAAPEGLHLHAAASASATSVRLGDIAVGSDGNLWFPQMGANRIGRITTAGVVTEFTIPAAAALGRVIAAGPDGRLWALGSGSDARVHVWAVETSGAAHEIAVLGDNPPLGLDFLPAGITPGPDGNIWISNLSEIVRVSPAGQVARFPIAAGAVATSITVGPDGNLWFLDSIGPFLARHQRLCRITTAGAIEQVLYDQTTQGASAPSSIIVGPDRNLWFADSGYSQIVRVTVSPLKKTVFPFPGASELAAGPDGNIWITLLGRNAIARLMPSGGSTEFELPTPLSNPSGIVAGTDGNLWFTEPDHDRIGRITPDGAVTEFLVGLLQRAPIHSSRSPRVVESR